MHITPQHIHVAGTFDKYYMSHVQQMDIMYLAMLCTKQNLSFGQHDHAHGQQAAGAT